MAVSNIYELADLFAGGQRERFLTLCQDYYRERVRQEMAERAGGAVPNTRRSDIHTVITKMARSLSQSVSFPLPSRQEIGEMIMQDLGGYTEEGN